MLELQSIQKTFHPGSVNERRALRDLSLKVTAGEFVTLIGSNGAGKSTLFGAICGSFPLDSGRVLLDGQDVTRQKEHLRARSIGRLFQDPLMGTAPSMTIEENLRLAYTRNCKDGKKPDAAFYREQLAQLHMDLETRMKTQVGALSGGQRQALTLLMATIARPKLLLLDEHTAALDPATAEKVLALTERIVSEHRIATLMITHNIADALRLGARTIMMDAGRILLDIQGAEREAMTVERLLDAFRERSHTALTNDRMLLR